MQEDLYPIFHLEPDAKEAIEQLGSKPKFWFRFHDSPEDWWLFKFARENTGEDWAEKIAAEVAVLLGVDAARMELADFVGRQGIASLSFVDTKQGIDLFHGSEVLAGRVIGYERKKIRRHTDHSVKNIIRAIEETFADLESRKTELEKIAGLVVLDAVIGNVDRHHDNWGLLRRTSTEGGIDYRLSPSFDHASSLGRELGDDRRIAILQQKGVADYLHRGHGGVYWDEQEKRAPGPLDLAVEAAKRYPHYFAPWIQRVREFDLSNFGRIL